MIILLPSQRKRNKLNKASIADIFLLNENRFLGNSRLLNRFKGIVGQNICSFAPCFSLLQNIKDGIVKNVGNQTVSFLIDFDST